MTVGDIIRYSIHDSWEGGVELQGIADSRFKYDHESMLAVLLDMCRNGNSI